MRKKLIRLTENDLHRIVKNSVKRVIKEDYNDGYDEDFDDDEYEEENNSFYNLDVSEKSDELTHYLGPEILMTNIISYLDNDTLNEMFDSIYRDYIDGNL